MPDMSLLERGLEHAPALVLFLVGFIIIVSLFLRFMARREQSGKEMAERCHEVTDKAVQAIERNSEAIGGNTEVLRDAKEIMKETKEVLIRMNGR